LAHAAARLTGLTARAITTFSMSLGGMWPARSTCGGLATALVNSTVTFKAGGEFPSAPVAYPFWRLQNDGVWVVTSTAPRPARQSNTDPPKGALPGKDPPKRGQQDRWWCPTFVARKGTLTTPR